MGKANKKNETVEVVESNIQPKDLSIEKRCELYNKERDTALASLTEKYGLAEDIELVFNRKGIIPRVVLMDLTAKNNGEQNGQN
jgi:hypothetical protein